MYYVSIYLCKAEQRDPYGDDVLQQGAVRDAGVRDPAQQEQLRPHPHPASQHTATQR